MDLVTTGIHQMPAAEYHADPCPAPSLSSSIINVMLGQSPKHAWTAHPKLNPNYHPDDDEKFDLGTAAHAYLLEGVTGVKIIQAQDYRKAGARLVRDQAIRSGKLPILAHKWDAVQAMAVEATKQCAVQEAPHPFTLGKPEQTLIWEEDGLWCRARCDWLHDSLEVIDDYKTTSATAEPNAWTRGPLFSMGYDVQAAWYLRGLKWLTGVDATFRFIVQESYPPYALSVIALGPDVLAFAQQKVGRALDLWRECLATGTWPAYPTRTCWAQLPPWEEQRWAERQFHDNPPAPFVDPGGDIGDLLS